MYQFCPALSCSSSGAFPPLVVRKLIVPPFSHSFHYSLSIYISKENAYIHMSLCICIYVYICIYAFYLDSSLNWSYWFGQKVCLVFFHKTKDTFFIFTNNLIDLGILSMSPVSLWFNVDCSQLISRSDHCQLQLAYLIMEHRSARNLQQDTPQTTFDTFNQS